VNRYLLQRGLWRDQLLLTKLQTDDPYGAL